MRSLNTLAVVLIVSSLAVLFCQAKTECERKREDAEKLVKSQEKKQNLNLAIIVPDCDAEGNYKQLQCHHGSPFCQCWDKDGSPLSSPSKNLKKCSCMEQRSKELKTIPASSQGTAYLTSCQNTGDYTPKQCKRDACWCVNPETGKPSSPENKNKSAVSC